MTRRDCSSRPATSVGASGVEGRRGDARLVDRVRAAHVQAQVIDRELLGLLAALAQRRLDLLADGRLLGVASAGCSTVGPSISWVLPEFWRTRAVICRVVPVAAPAKLPSRAPHCGR